MAVPQQNQSKVLRLYLHNPSRTQDFAAIHCHFAAQLALHSRSINERGSLARHNLDWMQHKKHTPRLSENLKIPNSHNQRDSCKICSLHPTETTSMCMNTRITVTSVDTFLGHTRLSKPPKSALDSAPEGLFDLEVTLLPDSD